MQNHGFQPTNAANENLDVRLPHRPTFLIACWLLAMMAFALLIAVGTGLTRGKVEISPPQLTAIIPPAVTYSKPVEPRSIEEILASVGGNPSSTVPAADTSQNTDTSPTIRMAPLLSSSMRSSVPTSTAEYQSPVIADPVVEKLVTESRALHLDGDMMRAMLKLDEAARIDPSEAAVIYQRGLLFEEMGLYIKAADQYQQVQQMGIQAGVYFQLSAKKLTKGMDVTHAHRPVISIGPMNARPATEAHSADKTHVTITLLARPDKPVNPEDVYVQVYFYDKLNGGEIKKASKNAKIEESWDTHVDWLDAGNEETVHIDYTLPESDLADEHLFGRRQFFGYVVELLYKGEVVDQQASPRRLNSIHGNKIAAQYKQSTPWLPEDQNSLLPGKNYQDYSTDPALLPLPTR